MSTTTSSSVASQKKAAKSLRNTTSPFQQAYRKLNAMQKQAVDTIEGPVMVIAGPGTGKTQVIALRTANILKKTQMRPGNILCLTFSTSGATAMRERLRELIGSDAYGVTVRNFHGFCNELIADYPLVFDSWSALEQISDVERYRELNKIIDQLLPDLALVNRKLPYRRTAEILSAISQLKREGMTDKKELLSIADAYEQELSQKSKEGTKAHEKNLLAARKFRELLEVFFRYQDMLQQSQRYDYEDMILYVTQALQEEPWLLQSLQERYQYILVDEFQDTNGSQYKLLELLMEYESIDHLPNVCIVGDDDQAIYRFQGANLQNILSFHEQFPEAPVIPLTTSYRCSQEILDAASGLIRHNAERLEGKVEGFTKNLTAGREVHEPRLQPNLIFSPSDTTEAWMIADLIEERIANGTDPEQIAILVQKNAELEPLYDVLAAREIPVQMSGKVDLLGHHLVRQLIAIMKAIINPRDNSKLAAALSCSCFGCSAADLGRVFSFLRSEEAEGKCLMDVLLMFDDAEPFALASKESMVHARDTLLDLHHKLDSRTIVDTLEHALKECDLLPETTKDFDPIDFAALQEFFERIKYRAYEQPGYDLMTCLSDIEYYLNAEYGELRLRYDLPHITEDGVQLMTAHQSKGLEFDTVILPNFRHGHWDKKRTPSKLSLPEDLLFGWVKSQKEEDRFQDERRLTYVAMTRARHELIFTCPEQLSIGDKMRDVSPSGFFAEAGELPESAQDLKDPSQTSTLLFEPVIKQDEALKAFLQERLENYALSVTALNHFLSDPQMFLEIDLLQMPQAKEPSMVYGNAVHDALRKWGLSVQQGEPFDQKVFIEAFNTYLSEREILTEPEQKRLLAIGHDALPRYFDERMKDVSPVIHRLEFGITASMDEVPIKGKIDRIDLKSPESAVATIIDYKTGRPQTEKQIKDGDYYRQLVFYALLLEHSASLLKPEAFVLDFIGEGSEHPVERRFEVSVAEKKELTQIVKDVWRKIIAQDFTLL